MGQDGSNADIFSSGHSGSRGKITKLSPNQHIFYKVLSVITDLQLTVKPEPSASRVRGNQFDCSHFTTDNKDTVPKRKTGGKSNAYIHCNRVGEPAPLHMLWTTSSTSPSQGVQKHSIHALHGWNDHRQNGQPSVMHVSLEIPGLQGVEPDDPQGPFQL